MKILIALAVIVGLIALYVVWLRPLMKRTAWGQAALDKIEPIERVLWKNSESILWARVKMALGVVLASMASLGAIDLTPLLPFLPEKYLPIAHAIIGALPMLIAVDGLIGEKLRNGVTKPIEIVAMRTDAPVEVKVAAAEADAVTKQAVEAVKATEPQA